jgi:hypothetical protein
MTRDDHGEAVKGIAFKPRKKSSMGEALQALSGNGDMADVANYVFEIAKNSDPPDLVLLTLAVMLDPKYHERDTHKLMLMQNEPGNKKQAPSRETLESYHEYLEKYELHIAEGKSPTAAYKLVANEVDMADSTVRNYIQKAQKDQADAEAYIATIQQHVRNSKNG